MSTGFRILLYVLFAILATAANLGVQRYVFSLGDGNFVFSSAIILGTFVGLLLKFILDKRWIFLDYSTGLMVNGHKFSIYAAMGVITTAIFWCLETVFWINWGTEFMREVGAILGLAVGYTIKYFLDVRYVFVRPERNAEV